MRYLIFLLPIILFGGEYFAKVEPYETYTIASKISGLVTYVDTSVISHKAKNQILVKIDDEIAKINHDTTLATYNIKRQYYNKIKKLTTKSKNEKDLEKIAYLSAKQAYIVAKDNLQSRVIRAKNLYIEDILVRQGNYVNPGTPLIKAYDTSKAKITIFANKEDIKNIENRKILVNGKSDFKLYRFFNIADSVQISSYKVELVGPPPKRFSSIAKVQIK